MDLTNTELHEFSRIIQKHPREFVKRVLSEVEGFVAEVLTFPLRTVDPKKLKDLCGLGG